MERASRSLTKLLTTVALSAAKKFGVETQRVHLDSSSLVVEGEYVADTQTSEREGTADEPVPIQITYGYSRDRRPDLKQFMIDTICSGDGDVPLYLRVADGNEADPVGFGKVVAQYRQQWQFDGMLVADAALYTAENLQQLAGIKWISRKWISRVPLT
jgi:transposase